MNTSNTISNPTAQAQSAPTFECHEVGIEELEAAGAIFDKLASGTMYPVGTRFIDGTVQS